jgi:hypothetical protein
MHFANYVGDVPISCAQSMTNLLSTSTKFVTSDASPSKKNASPGCFIRNGNCYASRVLAAYRGGLVLSALVALRDVDDDLPAAASTRRVPPASIVELEIWNDMGHIWPFFAAILPEGQQAIEPMGKFARARMVST